MQYKFHNVLVVISLNCLLTENERYLEESWEGETINCSENITLLLLEIHFDSNYSCTLLLCRSNN